MADEDKKKKTVDLGTWDLTGTRPVKVSDTSEPVRAKEPPRVVMDLGTWDTRTGQRTSQKSEPVISLPPDDPKRRKLAMQQQ